MSSQTIFLTAGATSKTVDVTLVQKSAATSPGDPITGLAYNTASLTAYYRLGATGTLTAITLATQTVGGAYSSGGFVEISATNAPGQYRFDIPNACIASAGFCAITFTGAANMATHTINIIVTAVDLYDTVRMGLTALPNVASGNSGAIPTVGTGTAQISVSGGRAAADVTYWNGSVLTGKTGAFPEFGIIDSGTAQSATGTTLALRSAAAFADDELNGATILIVSASTGAGQRRVINDYVGSTDTATVDTWTTTPTGTIVYAIFGSPPASVGLPVPANVTQIGGDSQSATDLKDFADAGYDPSTNKVQGLVLADAVTTVNGLAANVITAAATAADFTTEIQSGLATASALATVDDFLDTEVAAILAAVDTEVAAIKAKTDQMVFTKTNELDVNVQSINGATVTGDGNATPWDGA